MPSLPLVHLETRVVRSQNQLAGDIDHEIVLLSIDRGEYYELNGAGSRIWELIETPVTVSSMVDRLCEEFDVARATCESQVLDFLGKMLTEGLISVEEPTRLDGRGSRRGDAAAPADE